ncbi:hypothetical protein VNI00_009746 [Paramarasmius palmivorus]|uniref:DUF6593 domain-containing protein n=1 Tax=Paramarasmius palmivorus TaxID=297713 RepID=A0AAW0CKS3_9AGAR
MASLSTVSFSTLVDPAYHISQTNRLTFDQNNIRNTTISIQSSPAYILKTTAGTLGTKTELIDALTKQPIGSIERKELLPDVVKLKSVDNSKPIKLNKWLHKVKLPDGSTGTKVNISSQSQFIWKTHTVHRLALYPESSDTFTACMEPATPSSSLALLIFPGAMQYADQIILSFLALEQELRMSDNSMRNANGMMVAFSNPLA